MNSSHIAVILFTIFFSLPGVVANELSKGNVKSMPSVPKEKTIDNLKDVLASPLARNKCPKVLVDSVRADQDDKYVLLSNRGKTDKVCGNLSFTAPGQVKPNLDLLKKPEAVADSFKEASQNKFSEATHTVLNGCKDLPANFQAAVATRYYAALNQIADYNGQIADEISFIDSLIPGSNSNDFECGVKFPEQKNRCPVEVLKTPCEKSPDQRLTDLAGETIKALNEIGPLLEKEKNCKSEVYQKAPRTSSTAKKESETQKKCGAITQLIISKKADYPWIDGAEFQKVALEKKAYCSGRATDANRKCFSTEYKSDKDTIKKAITAQLKLNRQGLIEGHKKSLVDYQCLIAHSSSEKNKCNFEDIRKNLSEMSPVTLKSKDQVSKYLSQSSKKTKIKLTQKQVSQNIELDQFLNIENCLIKEGQQIKETQDLYNGIAKEVAINAAVIAASGGAAALARSTLILGKLGRYSNVAQKVAIGVPTGIDGFYATDSALAAYKECNSADKIEISQIASASVQNLKAKICDDSKSAFNQAKIADKNCREQILYALIDGGSAAVGLGLLAKSARTVDKAGGVGKVDSGSVGGKSGDVIKLSKPPKGISPKNTQITTSGDMRSLDLLIEAEHREAKRFGEYNEREQRYINNTFVNMAEDWLTSDGYKFQRITEDGFDRLQITEFPGRVGTLLRRYQRKVGDQLATFEYNPRNILSNGGPSGASYYPDTHVIELDSISLSTASQGELAYIKHELRHARETVDVAQGKIKGIHGALISGGVDGNESLTGAYKYYLSAEEVMTWDRQQIDLLKSLRRWKGEIEKQGASFFKDPRKVNTYKSALATAKTGPEKSGGIRNALVAESEKIQSGLSSSIIQKHSIGGETVYIFGDNKLSIDFDEEKTAKGTNKQFVIGTPAFNSKGERRLASDGSGDSNFFEIPVPFSIYQQALSNPEVAKKYILEHLDKMNKQIQKAHESGQRVAPQVDKLVEELDALEKKNRK